VYTFDDVFVVVNCCFNLCLPKWFVLELADDLPLNPRDLMSLGFEGVKVVGVGSGCSPVFLHPIQDL
jgi:hypothetical protein